MASICTITPNSAFAHWFNTSTTCSTCYYYPSSPFLVGTSTTKHLCSLNYTMVDQAIQRVMCLGAGALLAKMDIQHAFCNIPVHPVDRKYLGMSWPGKIYVDTVLPFGLRSSLKIFNAVADALEWILLQEGITIFLWILMDTIALEMHLPEGGLVKDWLNYATC